MLEKMIAAALRNRLLVVLLFLVAFAAGLWALVNLPVDAFPDTTPVQVQINTIAPSLGPEEIETQLSLPVELAVSGLPGLIQVRSISKFGLSQVVAIFEDEMAILDSRQLIMERLAGVELPEGIARPELGPISTGLGEVFHYVLRSENPNRTLSELRTLHDWVVKPQLRKVPGVAEVNSWGGLEKQFHVIVAPEALIKYGLTYEAVATALRANNANVGGGQVVTGGQTLLVHGLGRVSSVQEIADIVVVAHQGVPVLIRDVAEVAIGHELRRGAVSAGGKGEAVLGLGFMLMGENSREVTGALKAALERVKTALPEDVLLEIVYDRTELVDRIIETVKHNLVAGAILVIAVLFLLLGNLRAGLLVAATIPMAMLFAALGMHEMGIAASLLSLGAIDFGILVDGSVVMTEANLRRLTERQMQLQRPLSVAERFDTILSSSQEVVRPIVFGMGIIVLVFLPVLTLEGIEGKMFKPMAWTFIFALVGALLVAVFLSPVLSFHFLPKKLSLHERRVDGWLKRFYGGLLQRVLEWRRLFLAVVLVVLLGATFLGFRLGGEFLPRLSEGALVVSVVRLAGVSVEESVAYNTQMERLLLQEFPDEISHIWSRLGSAEVATDPMGTELTDIFLTLHPRDQWTRAESQAELTSEVEEALHGLPGIRIVLSQPIELRVNEMLSGIRGDVGIKIYGDKFDRLEALGEEVEHLLSGIPGASDVAVEPITGQPTLQIAIDRKALARHGVAAREVLDVIAAVGTPKVGEVFEGERSFPLVLRLPDAQRQDPEALADTLISTASGAILPLRDLAEVRQVDRPSTINREWGRRLIKVSVNVRDRDIASFVAEAQAKVSAGVRLPEGYLMEWGGQFENLQRSQHRLMLVVPLTLLLIFLLLYFSLKRLRDVLIIYTGIPLAAIGGIVALYLRGIPFSVSAAIGFIALSGIAVLNGQMLVSAIRGLLDEGLPLLEAVTGAAKQRLVPVLATAVTDAVGFLPMALSVGVGAEVQRPLATVVVGGVFTSTLLTLFLLPILYLLFHRRERT
ncbi:heavy metal efflux pump, CzcA family [Desulfuromonas soudanensis]|uniref:Heavy metal efflux pump, CzcA family n=1 Tax=Desulfuromonas soudanensis TaxID=1603606 RepID=A0A0M3QGA3_9BACT|nr:CusA/CzcA family heavy metal efflux RND transporter [Desulfuromonas soudanensis]ALC17629.1 heavy metal efflux pump, CzcA family [Desulfuromonas soudanensis]